MHLQRIHPNSTLHHQLGRLAENAFRGFWDVDPWTREATPHTHASVVELDQQVLVRIELPGVDPEHVEISLADDVLTLAVKIPDELAAEDAPLERYRDFTQSLRLPCPVDGEQADAQYRHGVLKITLPKPTEILPRQISIKVS